MTKEVKDKIEDKDEGQEAISEGLPLEEKETSSKRGTVLIIVGILLFMSFLSGVALQSFGGFFLETGQIFSPAASSLVQGRLSQLEERMADMEEKVKLLKALQSQVKTATSETKIIEKKVPAIAPARLKKIEKKPLMLLAFLEMKEKALSGKVFEENRQRFRHFVDDDAYLIELLLALEKNALTGTASIKNLREMWRGQAISAQKALRDAAAKTWQDRLVVALESLVSVHSMKPEVEDSLSITAVDLDLAEGNIESALQKADAMPEQVVAAIGDWREKAKERLDVEKRISQISDYLIDGRKPKEEPTVAPPVRASKEKIDEATP